MRIIGHRGARFEAPENTIAGFRYALDLDLDGFEFDVHLSRDNELVVIHDDTVDRTTNGSGKVSDMTLADLQGLDGRSHFDNWPEPCQIPTYAQVLDVVGEVSWLETEIKTDTPERLEQIVPMVVEEVRSRSLEDQVLITSFNIYALELAQRVAPDIRRGYIGAWDSQEFLDTAKRLGVSLVGIPYATGRKKFVEAARSEGMIASGWPTNTKEALESAYDLEVDSICTDAPTAVRAMMR